MDRVAAPSDQGKNSPPKKVESPGKLFEEVSRKRKRPSRESMLEHSTPDSSSDEPGTSSIGMQVLVPRSKEMAEYWRIVAAREAKQNLAEGSSGSSEEELEQLTKGFTPFLWRTSTPKKSEDCRSRCDHVDTPMVQLSKREEKKQE